MLGSKSDDGRAFIGLHGAVWRASVNRDESECRQPAQQSSRRADRKGSSLCCTPVNASVPMPAVFRSTYPVIFTFSCSSRHGRTVHYIVGIRLGGERQSTMAKNSANVAYHLLHIQCKTNAKYDCASVLR